MRGLQLFLVAWCLAGIGCGTPVPSQVQGAQKHAEFEQNLKRVGEIIDEAKSKVKPSERSWRFAFNALYSDEFLVNCWGGLALSAMVLDNPELRPVALAVFEERAVNANPKDPLQKTLWLTQYSMVLAQDLPRETNPKPLYKPSPEEQMAGYEAGVRENNCYERAKGMGQFDEATKRFFEGLLKDPRDVQISTKFLLLAGIQRQEDKAWALRTVERQIKGGKARDKKYWTVVREAINCKMENP